MQQAVTEQSPDRVSHAGRQGFRRLLVLAAATTLVLLLAQLALAVHVTPIFADLYAEAGVTRPPTSWRVVFSLSQGPGLALLIVALDGALFALAYVVARHTRPWVLFIPAIVMALAAAASLPLLYQPLFQLIDVVR